LVDFLKSNSTNIFQQSHTQPLADTGTISTCPQLTEDLPVPPPLPIFCKEEYPNTRYWTKGDFKDVKKLCNKKGTGLYSLAFLVNEDGQPLSATELKDMWEYFKMLCNTLFSHHQNPKSWKAKTHTASTYVRNMMCTKFNSLCLSKNHWKFEEYATLKYPNWVTNSASSGILQRMWWFDYDCPLIYTVI